MKFPRFYVRRPTGEPRWAQDHTTWILLGRWTHQYHQDYGLWFSVSNVPSSPWDLVRPGTSLERASFWEFYGVAGRRFLWELLSDLLGKRFKRLYRVPQDFTQWDQDREPPVVQVGDWNGRLEAN